MARGMALAISVVALMIGFAAGTQVAHGQAPGAFGRNVNHVNLMVRDIDKTVQALADVWGVPVPKISTLNKVPFPPDGTSSGRIKVATVQLDNLRLEVIQPLDTTPSPWFDFLQKCGEGIHHFGIDASNVPETVKYLETKGGKWTLGPPNGSFAYVDLTPRLPFSLEILPPAPPKR